MIVLYCRNPLDISLKTADNANVRLLHGVVVCGLQRFKDEQRCACVVDSWGLKSNWSFKRFLLTQDKPVTLNMHRGTLWETVYVWPLFSLHWNTLLYEIFWDVSDCAFYFLSYFLSRFLVLVALWLGGGWCPASLLPRSDLPRSRLTLEYSASCGSSTPRSPNPTNCGWSRRCVEPSTFVSLYSSALFRILIIIFPNRLKRAGEFQPSWSFNHSTSTFL